ncbi:hypothetical protein KIPB_010379, partial [Kipferlia bialata]
SHSYCGSTTTLRRTMSQPRSHRERIRCALSARDALRQQQFTLDGVYSLATKLRQGSEGPRLCTAAIMGHQIDRSTWVSDDPTCLLPLAEPCLDITSGHEHPDLDFFCARVQEYADMGR